MSHGSILLDELILPIVEVKLEGGGIVAVGVIAGPVAGRECRGCVVVGSDGRVVAAAPDMRVRWPKVRKGDEFRFTVSLHVGDDRIATGPDETVVCPRR